ncbi:MAG: SusD/RagB family nutrient-binding outer membrane lipoprotein [Bacteroidota bacterium]|nr:SusD/RagB family nutrient-binding outer membrane lipoprotein [Bacteroidota bacterium]
MKKIAIIVVFVSGLFMISSCKKFLDINTDPDRLPAEKADIALLLTSATANVGFTGGSDLQRYAALIMQQYSGQSTGAQNQTQDYEKYLITGSDVNNLFSTVFATTLNDLETIIQKAGEEGSPNYAGVAKILKAYTYQTVVDAWGDLPYSEAQKLTNNLAPKYDDGAQIYKSLIALLDQGIADVNQTASKRSPGTNSLIYPGTFSTTKTNWVKFANTLKLRLFLHYSKIDKAFLVSQITSLVTAGGPFMTSTSDNFQMVFINATNRQNPIQQFEIARSNYLFANATLVDSMNARTDPRRATYFTQYPARSGNYKGAKAGDAPSQQYSRFHVYLRGDTLNSPTPAANGSYAYNAYTYTGDAPIRMLTYAEYNFIRAEAALYGAPGDPQTFFQEGIKASMSMARVSTTETNAYIAVNGLLVGTSEEKLKRIITEKYVASYGVLMEPWTDWRRTGYPVITKVPNAVIGDIPRSLLYPQSEIDLNPNAPKQKADMLVRVFWDK